MKLHVVYRLYGGENRKGRPLYYNKRRSLASALRAVQIAGADFTLLADGPIPGELRAMASQFGPVVDLAGGPVGMRGSFLASVRYPHRAGWSDDDVVYFCEDDYLHLPQAFAQLFSAAEELEDAHYFALYASTPANPALGPGVAHTDPRDWRPHPDRLVGERRWVNVASTTSTFGARVGSLRQDLGIIRQGMIPYPNRLLDHEMCLVYQGRFPYTFGEIFRGPEATRFRTGVQEFAANAVLTPFRAAYDLRALSRRRNPHLLYAADPNLASHMEVEFLSPTVDWSDVATAAEAWTESA